MENTLTTLVPILLVGVALAGLLFKFQHDTNGRLDRLDSRIDRLEARMDRLDSRIDRLESRMDAIESRLSVVEGRLSHMEGFISGLMTSGAPVQNPS